MLNAKGRRIRHTFGTCTYNVMRGDGYVPEVHHASPQIITHATAERWASEGRTPRNRLVVSR